MGHAKEISVGTSTVHGERYRLWHACALYLIDGIVYSVERRVSIAKHGTKKAGSLPFPTLELPVEV
jgi:hypothetical protein